MSNPPHRRRIVVPLLSLTTLILYCYALFFLNEMGIIPHGWRFFVFAGLYVLVGTLLGAFLAFINRLL